jgi:hypothetical protein
LPQGIDITKYFGAPEEMMAIAFMLLKLLANLYLKENFSRKASVY